MILPLVYQGLKNCLKPVNRKGQAIITAISGTVEIVENKGVRKVIVTGDEAEPKTYTIPYGARLRVLQWLSS